MLEEHFHHLKEYWKVYSPMTQTLQYFSNFLSYDIITHTYLRRSFEIVMVNPLNQNEI